MDHVDWMDEKYARELAGALARQVTPGGRVIWRSAALEPPYVPIIREAGFTVRLGLIMTGRAKHLPVQAKCESRLLDIGGTSMASLCTLGKFELRPRFVLVTALQELPACNTAAGHQPGLK